MSREYGRKSSTFVDDKRWDLFYQITEAYIRAYKREPSVETTYEGVRIGMWLYHQKELSGLGLLAATRQHQVDQLDILVAELNPPLSPLLAPLPKAPRPLSRATPRRDVPKPAPRPTARPVTPPPRAPSPPISAAATSAPERAPAPSTEPTTVPVPEPPPVPLTEPEPQVQPEKPEKEEDIVPTPSVDPKIVERINAVTDFWQKYGRLPRRSEKDIRAGGSSLTYWVWTLPPLLAKEELPEELRDLLSKTSWWGDIEKRADKLLKANGYKKEAGERLDTPAAEESEKNAPIDKDAHRKPYVKELPHRKNPLAQKSREEHEAKQAEEAASPTVQQLPEVGVISIIRDDIGEFRYDIEAKRYVGDDAAVDAAKAVEYLTSRKSSAIEHIGFIGGFINITIGVSNLVTAVERLEDLGYRVTEIYAR